jgi:two-component system phosphate regulon sensor histidine kinase PhoR
LIGALPWLLLWLSLVLWAVASYRAARRSTRRLIEMARTERLMQELDEQVAGLRAELAAERKLIARLPDPVLVFGPDRSLQRLNIAAQNTFGPEMSALLRHPSFRGALERAQAEGKDECAELSLPVPIARDLHATVLAVPADEGGKRLVAVLSDRTRDRAVERMRADFVANASHELRTPLASVIGFIDTLRGPAADDPAAQTRFLGIMAEQAQRMNRLIDDLLSLSRIELSEHMPPSGRVVLEEIVSGMAAAFAPQLQARGTTLKLDLPSDLPELPGDAHQLEQVLQNLLDNALKYGRPGGTIVLSARPSSRSGQGGVMLKVRDQGVGIPREHIPRLTERFYRVDTHRSRSVGGTGLGLAIVKHIVNRHRGQLGIDSTEGLGTTVSVWLPT